LELLYFGPFIPLLLRYSMRLLIMTSFGPSLFLHQGTVVVPFDTCVHVAGVDDLAAHEDALL